MAKKKEIVNYSVSLFGDDIETPVIKSKSSKSKKTSTSSIDMLAKTSKKASRNESKEEGEALNKKTNKSISKKKTVKKNESGKIPSVSNNKSRTSVSSKSNKSSNLSKIKKEDKRNTRTEQAGTPNSKQKSKALKRTASSNTDVSVKKSAKASKNRCTDDINSKSVEAKTGANTRSGTKIKNVSSRSENTTKGKSRVASSNEELFKSPRRRKHKQEKTSRIQPPRQITGKPKVINDFLVSIIIDGEYIEVSPWSIKDGIYHQGLDSNFLVKYLCYKPVATKLNKR